MYPIQQLVVATTLLLATTICNARVSREAEDLCSFKSRPDLRPPKFNITAYDETQIAPGYIFVAPYPDLRDRVDSREYIPGQVGPHIYNGNGDLIWSGAHLFGTRQAFDFKVANCSSPPCFTFIIHKSLHSNLFPRGAGVVLNSSLHVKDTFVERKGIEITNMHEFTLTESRTVLRILYRPMLYSNTSGAVDLPIEEQPPDRTWVANGGFDEVDAVTGETIFEWWALKYFNPFESFSSQPKEEGVPNKAWDAYHINSIDKDSNGDYLVSSRYLHTVFKVSKTDGSVLWRLGGPHSSFELQGFSFSSQHDARFRSSNSTHTIISLLNNASDNFGKTSNVSSAMIISLDHSNMVASLLQELERPDKTLSRLRGNVQLLPSKNNFVCWSDNARISEFTPDGTLLLDGQFVSRRFVTYRAFKFDVSITPSEPPALKAFIYGTSPSTQNSTTAIYASWNGATEIHRWNFYGSNPESQEHGQLLGSQEKTGFETELMVSGPWCSIYAEAVSRDGTTLSTTQSHHPETPASWNSPVCAGQELDSQPAHHNTSNTPEDSSHIPTQPTSKGDSSSSLLSSIIRGSSSPKGVISLYTAIAVLAISLCLSLWKLHRVSSSAFVYHHLDKAQHAAT